MEWIYTTGIAIIHSLQSLGHWLLSPMLLFTLLGDELFYLLVAPAIFWCLDAGLGFRMGLYLMVCGGLNSVIKIVFHGPRPYWYTQNVEALSPKPETSFGIPSGHAQNAVVFWGTLAHGLRKNWGWGIAVLLMFLIGLSRMYLAVHFPHDVLVGWLIGALLLWGLVRLETPMRVWMKKASVATQVIAALAISLALILLVALARLSLGGWTIPPEWVANASAAYPDSDPIDPLGISAIVSNAGAFFGMACGAILLARRGWFATRGTAGQLILRYLIGLAGTALFYFGLRAIFPGGEDAVASVLRYLRYGLAGFWIAGLAPILFIKLKLAEPAWES
jgi:membrane-associated phospholipid phosphatase